MFTENALNVLKRRYLVNGETPDQLLWRVARAIAIGEMAYYSKDASEAEGERFLSQWAERFYAELLEPLYFLPNSPCLGNAGRPLGQLSACFVLPVPDDMHGIFKSVHDTAMIHQSGGGTGFAFSALRPAGSRVKTTNGVSSGPVSFMRVFDAATEVVKQGGTRRGANMGILHVSHPDIEEFIHCKSDMTSFQNFNISVAVTDDFMEAVVMNTDWPLINPHTGETVKYVSAVELFDAIVAEAHRNGDPGLFFIDRANADNPTPHLGSYVATNPCGEEPLLPYESCTLGSIDLSRFVRPYSQFGSLDAPFNYIRWSALHDTVNLAIRFLDDVVTVNRFPVKELADMNAETRRIGLGVMGWADVLFQLQIPYDSPEAIDLANRVMSFIRTTADAASERLALARGGYPAHKGDRPMRNSTRTTVAPTGTLSILADCTGGIEPAFALSFKRQHRLDRENPNAVTQMFETNKHFLNVLHEYVSDERKAEILDAVAHGIPLSEVNKGDLPQWVINVYKTANELSIEAHIRMQAAFQDHIDAGVSKTVNLPEEATGEDIAYAYFLAWEAGCKGITTYRDKSRDGQVLSYT